ncbi:osmotically inducible protein OsmC [candidate division KSB1 bacterium]|nr:osmotically inducible protein OsmC [candidate division KSB1 bacterium]
MKVEIRQVKGITMVGKGDSGHWVSMDGPEAFEGSNAGVRPLELFLMGLGGCTSMDVISILQKKRIKVDDYECILEAERAEEHPKVFTKVKVNFIFYGEDIDKKDVERAIELSENKYCSASAMLKKSVPIIVDYEIRKK